MHLLTQQYPSIPLTQLEAEKPWISDSRSFGLPVSERVIQTAASQLKAKSIHQEILSYSDCQSQFFSQTFILPSGLLSSQTQFPPTSSICMHSEFFTAGCPPARCACFNCPSPDHDTLKVGIKIRIWLDFTSQGRLRLLTKALYKWQLFIKNSKLHEVCQIVASWTLSQLLPYIKKPSVNSFVTEGSLVANTIQVWDIASAPRHYLSAVGCSHFKMSRSLQSIVDAIKNNNNSAIMSFKMS